MPSPIQSWIYRGSCENRRAVTASLLVVLVVFAGCSTDPGSMDDPPSSATAPSTDSTPSSTTESTDTENPRRESTTEPHTAKGTSHTSTHLKVRATAENLTVTIRLYEGKSAHGEPAFEETYSWSRGDGVDLTRRVHELETAHAVIVVNGDPVWNSTIYEYEMYRVGVNETAATVAYSVV